TGVTTQPVITTTQASAERCRASYRPSGAPAGKTVARIRERGILRVGGQQTYYLLSYRDPVTGEMSGFEVDLARHIAQAIFGDPTRIQFVALTVAEREPAIKEGKVDIVLAAMIMTCARWNNVAFSAEYLEDRQRVLVNSRSTAAGLDDLGDKRVCASAGGADIEEVAKAASHPKPVTAANAADCLILLQQGLVDAVSTSEGILAGLAAQDHTTKIVGPALIYSPVGAAMHHDATDLVRFVNGVLEQLRSSGEWDRMYRKWLEPSLGPAQAPSPMYQD